VARLIDGWQSERPDLDLDPVAIVYRVRRLAAYFAPETERVFTGSGITSADFAVLANLRRAGHPYQLTARELTDAVRLNNETLSERIDHLTERGLVRHDPAPDARGVLVTLTDEGAQTFDALAPEHLACEARLVAALDPQQQATLATLLQHLLVEYERDVEDPPDERLGLVLAAAHLAVHRRAVAGLAPRNGLLVEAVRPGGPAAAAGIMPGDLLLRTSVRDLWSLTSLACALEDTGPLTVDVARGDEDLTVTIDVPPGELGHRLQRQEVRHADEPQRLAFDRAYPAPGFVAVDARLGHAQHTPAGPELAAAGRLDVLHPVRVRTVRERDDVAVRFAKHVHRCLVLPAGAAAAVNDDAEAWHLRSDVPHYPVEADLVPPCHPSGNWHATSRSALPTS
jgi:DNA-binding MarR family transcriptional regulator